jgi:hypothetical protein
MLLSLPCPEAAILHAPFLYVCMQVGTLPLAPVLTGGRETDEAQLFSLRVSYRRIQLEVLATCDIGERSGRRRLA